MGHFLFQGLDGVQVSNHDQEKICANSVSLSAEEMRKDCAMLSDFSDCLEVSGMPRGEFARCFQSFASKTREAVSAGADTSHWQGKCSTNQ